MNEELLRLMRIRETMLRRGSPEDQHQAFDEMLSLVQDLQDPGSLWGKPLGPFEVPGPEPKRPSRGSKADLEERLFRLLEENESLKSDNEWLQQRLERADEKADHWRGEAHRLTGEMVQGSKDSLGNMLVFALHFAERQGLADALAHAATEALYQVRAVLSDTPEPRTEQLLQDLEQAVENLRQPPSPELLALLDRVTKQKEEEPSP